MTYIMCGGLNKNGSVGMCVWMFGHQSGMLSGKVHSC